jgi:hypothetical protein
MLALPAQYLLEIWNGAHSAVSAGLMIATITLAVFSIVVDSRPRAKSALSKSEIAAIVWFAVLGMLIIAASEKTTAWRSAAISFSEAFFPGIMAMILTRRVWERFAVSRLPLSFVGAFMTPCVFGMIPVGLMQQAILNLHLVYDGPLYRIDGLLGAGWNSWFASLMRGNSAFYYVLHVVYVYIVIWTGIASLWQQDRLPASHSNLLLSMFILGLAGFGLYYLMPAIDPAEFFGQAFPDALPPVQSVPDGAVPTASSAFRNAMPSLHAATAILAYLALRECPIWQRSIGGLIVVSTLCSTLGLGEHYTVDWVAAFPLVLFVRGVAAVYLPIFSPARLNAIAVGFLLETLWVVAVRGAPYSLAFTELIRALALASLILPFILELQLAQVERLERADSISDDFAQLRQNLPFKTG